jgi:hypothetical protein
VYAKARSYRKLDDVVQGISYNCGMTVADPLEENGDQRDSSLSSIPLGPSPTSPSRTYTFRSAVHATQLACRALRMP